MGIWL